ncbi:hypothetical protein HpSP79_18550 [Helicobacter pylori]
MNKTLKKILAISLSAGLLTLSSPVLAQNDFLKEQIDKFDESNQYNQRGATYRLYERIADVVHRKFGSWDKVPEDFKESSTITLQIALLDAFNNTKGRGNKPVQYIDPYPETIERYYNKYMGNASGGNYDKINEEAAKLMAINLLKEAVNTGKTVSLTREEFLKFAQLHRKLAVAIYDNTIIKGIPAVEERTMEDKTQNRERKIFRTILCIYSQKYDLIPSQQTCDGSGSRNLTVADYNRAGITNEVLRKYTGEQRLLMDTDAAKTYSYIINGTPKDHTHTLR